MKSTFRASRILASAVWPIRHFAITGIVTACWISRILETGDIRATPPSRRMSAGTRSSAITAAAPASSAIFACSALTTSMITPPLSISANPTLTRKTSVWFIWSSRPPSHHRHRVDAARSNHRVHRLGKEADSLVHVPLVHPRDREADVWPVLSPRVEIAARRDPHASRRGGLGHPAAGDSARQVDPEERVADLAAHPGDFRQKVFEDSDRADALGLDVERPGAPGLPVRPLPQERRDGGLKRQRSLKIGGLQTPLPLQAAV